MKEGNSLRSARWLWPCPRVRRGRLQGEEAETTAKPRGAGRTATAPWLRRRRGRPTPSRLVAPIALYRSTRRPDPRGVGEPAGSPRRRQLAPRQPERRATTWRGRGKAGLDRRWRARPVPRRGRHDVPELDWTKQLGSAFTSDQKAVLDAIQRLRASAISVGISSPRSGNSGEDDAGRTTGGDREAGGSQGHLRAAIRPAGRVHAGSACRRVPRTVTDRRWPGPS